MGDLKREVAKLEDILDAIGGGKLVLILESEDEQGDREVEVRGGRWAWTRPTGDPAAIVARFQLEELMNELAAETGIGPLDVLPSEVWADD